MEIFKLKTIHCKNCNYRLTAATNLAKERSGPKEGDFSICAGCASISKFNSDLDLIPLTPEELVDLFMKDQEIYEAVMKLKQYLHRIKSNR